MDKDLGLVDQLLFQSAFCGDGQPVLPDRLGLGILRHAFDSKHVLEQRPLRPCQLELRGEQLAHGFHEQALQNQLAKRFGIGPTHGDSAVLSVDGSETVGRGSLLDVPAASSTIGNAALGILAITRLQCRVYRFVPRNQRRSCIRGVRFSDRRRRSANRTVEVSHESAIRG